MTLLEDLDRRQERRKQDEENSARLAQSYATFTTTGIGVTQYEERVPFGLTFIERPVVAYGSYCDLDELANILPGEAQSDSDDTVLPQLTGYVVAWDQDERGFYTGCWVAAVVSFSPSNLYPDPTDLNDVAVEVEHHFTFAAIGMKDIPPSQEDATE